jgi:hypothetical protein
MKPEPYQVEVTFYRLRCSKCGKEFNYQYRVTVLKWATQHMDRAHNIPIPLTDEGVAITHAHMNDEEMMEAHLASIK